MEKPGPCIPPVPSLPPPGYLVLRHEQHQWQSPVQRQGHLSARWIKQPAEHSCKAGPTSAIFHLKRGLPPFQPHGPSSLTPASLVLYYTLQQSTNSYSF